MKKFIAFLTLCLLALFAVPPAQAQVTPVTPLQLTNLPAVYKGTFQANLFASDTNALGIPTNNVISLRQRGGLGTSGTVSNLIGSGGTLTFLWAVSLDGTNWSFPPYGGFYTTNTAGGTTPPIVSSANIPDSVLNNFLFASPYAITNTALAGTNTQLINQFVGLANIVSTGF